MKERFTSKITSDIFSNQIVFSGLSLSFGAFKEIYFLIS